MIDSTQFEEEIKDFYSYYNKRCNDKIIDFWYSKLRSSNFLILRNTLESFKYINKFPDFQAVLDLYRQKYRVSKSAQPRDINAEPKCHHCRDTGLILHQETHYGQTGEYAARCTCARGEMRNKEMASILEVMPDYFKAERQY